MPLDLFEDPEKADDEIGAVENDAGEDDTDERHLFVTDLVPHGPLVRGYIRPAFDMAPPPGRALGHAPQGGREVVVEAERERRGPHGYEEHFGGGMQEFCRGRP